MAGDCFGITATRFNVPGNDLNRPARHRWWNRRGATYCNRGDAGVLLTALNRNVTPDSVGEICLHAFAEPLAPNIAARHTNVTIEDAALVSFCKNHLAENSEPSGLCLIEGAGGFLSPATDSMLQADLMRALGLPAILVTANYLGSISHTLATLEAMERRNIPAAAIIVSQPDSSLADPTAFIDEMRRLQPAHTYIAARHNTDALALGCEVLDAVTS